MQFFIPLNIYRGNRAKIKRAAACSARTVQRGPGAVLPGLRRRRSDGHGLRAAAICPGVGAGAACDLGKLGRWAFFPASWAALRSGACLGPGPVLLSGVGRSGRGVSSCQAVPGPGAASIRAAAGGRRQGRGRLRGRIFQGRGRTLLPCEIFRGNTPRRIFSGATPGRSDFPGGDTFVFSKFFRGRGRNSPARFSLI